MSVVFCCAVAVSAAAQQPPKAPTRRVRRTPVQQPPARPTGSVAAGSVVKVDAARGTLLISGRTAREQPQLVEILPAAMIVKQFRASAAELKVGETIEVVGVPLQIDARTIRIGEVAPVPDDHPARTPPKSGAPTPPRQSPVVQPQLLAKVVRVNPLTIDLGGGVKAEVKVGGGTRFTRVARVPLNGVKPGDPVMVMGSRNATGALVAHRVQIGFEGFPGSSRKAAAPRPKPSVK
ncbi:MAG: DUF5666 domain-containing protein [Actinomycetota bacterium]